MFTLDFANIGFLHKKLVMVMRDIEDELGPFIITSLWRKDGGVHETIPLRGIDLRCKNIDVGRGIEKWINKRWEYDPSRLGREVCLYHDAGEGIHLHVQVHESTQRRV